MQGNIEHIVHQHPQNTAEQRLQKLFFIAFFFMGGKIAHFQKQHHKHKHKQPHAHNAPLGQLKKELVVRRVGNGFEFAQIRVAQQRFGLVLLKRHLEVPQPAAQHRAFQKDFFGHVPHKQTLV